MNLPQGWTKLKFDSSIEKISILNEFKIKQKDYFTEGIYPIIDQGEVFIGGYSNDIQKVIKCKIPVIVFGDHTRCVKYISFDFCAGADGIKAFNHIGCYDSKLFYYFVQVLAKKIPDKGYARHYQYLEKEFIPLPPLPEQHRIAAKIDSLFSELDNDVAFLKTIKTQLAIYRQAVLKWAFEGKLTTEWRKANDVENQEIVIKNIMIAREMEICKGKYKNIEPEFPLYDLPKEWKWVSIGCISKGVEYGTSAKSNKNGKVVVLRMGNIQNGTFVYDDLAYTSNKKEIEKYKLSEGDVLFNRTNSPELVGKTAIYTGSIPSIFAGYLIRLNQISYIDAKYLNYYLNSPHSKKCGNIAKTDGVNQSNINGTKLSTYPFPLCSKPEQLAIVSAIESRLSVCDKLEQTIDQTLALSASLRQSILKKAFEGRLVPQDPNDEPAEKLLERIKAEKAAVLAKQKQTRKRGRR